MAIREILIITNSLTTLSDFLLDAKWFQLYNLMSMEERLTLLKILANA